MKIGENLKKSREAAKLTRDEAAKRLNISKKTLTNYETDFTEPKFQQLDAMCKLYKIKISQVFGEEMQKKESEDKSEKSDTQIPYFEKVLEALNSDGSLLNKKFDTLDETKQAILKGVIDTCIKNLSELKETKIK